MVSSNKKRKSKVTATSTKTTGQTTERKHSLTNDINLEIFKTVISQKLRQKNLEEQSINQSIISFWLTQSYNNVI